MCMSLFTPSKTKTQVCGKNRFRKDKDGMIICYKIIKRLYSSGQPTGPFFRFDYKAGRNVSSRDFGTGLTQGEVDYDCVYQGFHLVGVLKEAKDMVEAYSSRGNWKVVRCLVDPKHVVSEGFFYYERSSSPNVQLLNLVATEMIIESMEAI
jgi:hypothetical protein